MAELVGNGPSIASAAPTYAPPLHPGLEAPLDGPEAVFYLEHGTPLGRSCIRHKVIDLLLFPVLS